MKQDLVSKQTHGTKAIPQFLIEAQADVAAGQIDEAILLLNDRAIESIEKKLEADPYRLDIIFMVAGLFHRTRQLDKAEYWYKKVLAKEPNPLAYINLGHICHFSGRISQAIEYRQKAIELCPDDASVYQDLGCSLIFTGRKKQGIEMLRKAVEMAPDDSNIHSTLLFRLHHMPKLNPSMLFEEHKRWARIHAPTSRARQSHDNVPDPDRRLKIGYISPDFRTHPVAYNFEAFLSGRNHQAVEAYGYGNVACPDSITEKLISQFDHYRNIRSLDDRAVAGMIEQDKIDILVAVGGHTPDNRLLVLAHKPAPIGVDYGGIDTSGMEQIDYRLTDSLIDRPESQKFYVEELVYLPGGLICYSPPDFAPPVAPLPAIAKGYITFGVFNNSSKINPEVMSLWAQILNANDKSRLLLKSRAGDDKAMWDSYYDRFERLGISPDRIEIQGQKPAVEYLRLFSQVDIALDTYPYNGCMTTLEGLWMGVPIVSLLGENCVSRVALSMLARIGLEFFAASRPEEYVAKACALAQNLEALVDIRSSMRQRIAASTLCNTKTFAHSVETAYRKMWHRWCRTKGVDVPDEQIDSVEQSEADRTICSSPAIQTTENPVGQT